MHDKFFILLALIMSCTGSLAKAADTVAEAEANFYRAVSRGDAAAAHNQMHPALQELIELPVLEAWSMAVRDHLGNYTSKTQTSFKRTQQLTGVNIDVESELQFENGTATASMEFLDGQVIAIELQSDQLVNWFQGPSRIDIYTKKAETFISAFFSQNLEQARSLMHDSLKKAASNGKFESIMQQVFNNAGGLESAQLKSHRMSLEKDRQMLILIYNIECEKASGECEIQIQFVGMKGHFISFDFR